MYVMTCMCSRCRNQGGWFAVRRRRQGMVLAGFLLTLLPCIPYPLYPYPCIPYPLYTLPPCVPTPCIPHPLYPPPPVSPTPIVAPVDVNPLNRPEQVAAGEGQEQQVCVCVGVTILVLICLRPSNSIANSQ